MSEEEDEEEEDEESEEELLALRREGWVCGSVAGFSAGISKNTPNQDHKAQKKASFFVLLRFSAHMTVSVNRQTVEACIKQWPESLENLRLVFGGFFPELS